MISSGRLSIDPKEQHYGKGQEPDKERTLMFGDFMIEGKWFAAMDSAHTHILTLFGPRYKNHVAHWECVEGPLEMANDRERRLRLAWPRPSIQISP